MCRITQKEVSEISVRKFQRNFYLKSELFSNKIVFKIFTYSIDIDNMKQSVLIDASYFRVELSLHKIHVQYK